MRAVVSALFGPRGETTRTHHFGTIVALLPLRSLPAIPDPPPPPPNPLRLTPLPDRAREVDEPNVISTPEDMRFIKPGCYRISSAGGL